MMDQYLRMKEAQELGLTVGNAAFELSEASSVNLLKVLEKERQRNTRLLVELEAAKAREKEVCFENTTLRKQVTKLKLEVTELSDIDNIDKVISRMNAASIRRNNFRHTQNAICT